jgi:hypothetical protein
MKNIKKLFVLLSFTLILFSCGGGSSPKGVAQDFMEALANKDFTKAKELGTDKTKGFISMLEGFMQMMPEEQKKDNDAFKGIENINWGETKIDGDTATVYYDNGEGKKDKITLKKVDGDWKVDMKKEL